MDSPNSSIVLIGMMGAGKSAVGAILEQRTGMPCIDLDGMIEKKMGLTVAEIFSRDGEERFRDLESGLLADIALGERAIIVTGGGIIVRPDNHPRLKRLGTVVWLDADAETLFERATRERTRPLLSGSEKPMSVFLRLLNQRRSIYRQLADVRIETTALAPEEVVERLLDAVASQPGRDS